MTSGYALGKAIAPVAKRRYYELRIKIGG